MLTLLVLLVSPRFLAMCEHDIRNFFLTERAFGYCFIMGNNGKNNKSFEIALSGVSCAIAVIFLTLGLITPFLTGFGYLVGILALMIPLSKRFYLGAFLAYAATCILAVALGAAVAFWDLVPFIMFFGLHPLVNSLQLKFKINKWIAFAVKAVWFDLTLITGFYVVYGGVLGGDLLPEQFYKIVQDYIWLFVFVLGTLFFLLYDRLIFKCQISVNILVNRIRK